MMAKFQKVNITFNLFPRKLLGIPDLYYQATKVVHFEFIKVTANRKNFFYLHNVECFNIEGCLKHFTVPFGFPVSAGSGHMLPSILEKRLCLNSGLAVDTARWARLSELELKRMMLENLSRKKYGHLWATDSAKSPMKTNKFTFTASFVLLKFTQALISFFF